MFAHGLQKLQGEPSGFGQALAGTPVPAPELMAYVLTVVELVGALLIFGLLSRLSALLLTTDLVVAILLVQVNVGLLSPRTAVSVRS